MKKNILIFFAILTTFSLAAVGYMNRNDIEKDQEEERPMDLNIYYHVSSRWNAMTKEELINARSVLDIFQKEGAFTRDAFENITVAILHNDRDVWDVNRLEIGQSEVFNAAQLKLLRSCDYSTNIRITTNCKKKYTNSQVQESDSLVRYITIVPEKEAEFEGGYDALINYLKECSRAKTSMMKKDRLQPGKVYFTVTKQGVIENIKLIWTSGYPFMDEILIKSIINTTGKWKPAENAEGEKVDQELVYFFGVRGC